MKIYCENCGAQIDANDAFCEKCGAKNVPHVHHEKETKSVQEKSQSEPLSQAPSTAHVFKRDPLHYLVYILVVIMGIALAYIFFYYIPQQQQVFDTQQAQTAQLSQMASSSEAEAQHESTVAQEAQNTAAKAQNEATLAQTDAASAQNDSNTLSNLVAEWSPSIPIIVCSFENGDELQGSATLIQFGDGTIELVTNDHVVTENNFTTGAIECVANFLNDPTNYTWYNDQISPASTGVDTAFMKITSPDVDTEARKVVSTKLCQVEPSIGDSILILGYPANGATQSITATEGIISGYDSDYYVTSAKIDHGSSGGAAIDVKNDCYLGIPTYTETDIESLARILKWQAWY